MQQSASSVVAENADSSMENIFGGAKFPEFPDASIGDPSKNGIGVEIGHEPKTIFSQQSIEHENISVQGSDIRLHTTSSHKSVQQKLIPAQEQIQRQILPPDEFVKHEVLPPIDVASSPVVNMQDCGAVESVSTERERYFKIIPNTIYDLRSKRSIAVSNFWCFEESFTEKGQRIVFSRSVMKQLNGVEVPAMERSVMVDTDRTLCYSVHGGAITDPEGCNLATTLTDTKLLPEILEKFKNMIVCSGLGAVNINNLSVDIALKDSVDQWRLSECALL